MQNVEIIKKLVFLYLCLANIEIEPASDVFLIHLISVYKIIKKFDPFVSVLIDFGRFFCLSERDRMKHWAVNDPR
jgi:hypothetical protein